MDNKQNAVGFVVACGVYFPVTGGTPGIDRLGAQGDGYALRNVAFGMLAANKPAAHTFAMALWKKRDQVTSVGVDPLIDRFVADGESGEIAADAAGDEFRGPTQTELGFDVAA